ncbi:hypothetical protein HMPREF3190_01615 [Umbribacter vaginalis]|nr:hypothetical protein HMPREF3190_01615 [Coriobacteriales bacterium DNF00809]
MFASMTFDAWNSYRICQTNGVLLFRKHLVYGCIVTYCGVRTWYHSTRRWKVSWWSPRPSKPL